MIELLNEAGGRWAPYFGLALVQNTIFLLLVFGALRLMRNASARARYAVAMVGLIKLVLPPFLKVPELNLHGLTVPPPLQDVASFGALFVDAAPAEAVAAAPSISFAGALLALWITGVIIAGLLPAIATARLALRLRDARPVVVEQSEDLDLPAGIHICLSQRISMPLILGVRPRKIYVPAAWDEWNEECRRMFLRHEMAHIRRADGAAMLVQSIARAIYFFHPLFYWLQNHLHEYREMACDEISIEPTKYAAVDYSRYLVDVAETALCNAAGYESASTLIPRRHELSRRVDYLMKGRTMSPHSHAKTGWIVACLVLLLLPLSWYDAPSGVDARAALISDKDDVEKSQRKGVTIELVEGGTMKIEGESTEVLELNEGILHNILKLDEKNLENMVIHLRCEDGVTMEELYGLQKLLTEMNLTKVNYGGETGPGLPLEMPPEEMIQKLGQLAENDVATLEVEASGEMTLAGENVKSGDIAGRITDLLEENPHLVLTIQTHAGTRYEHFMDALGQAKNAGATRIAVLPPRSQQSGS